MTETVLVCEVGPRDGLQMAKSMMPTAVKLRWIDAMVQAGVAHMEVGSFVPPRVVPQMADTAEVVRHTVTLPGLQTIVLAPNQKGAERAYAAGARAMVIPVSVSCTHSRSNTGKGTFDQVAEVSRLVSWVRAQEQPVHIEAACATAFGCSFEGEVPEGRVIEVATALLAAGADTISLADTVGYATPNGIRSLVRRTRSVAGAAFQKLHLHDTMGLGLANVLAGLDVGVRNFDASLAGLGGCPFAPGASGNIVTEDVVFLLESMGLRTGIDLDALIATRVFLQEGIPGEPLYGSVNRAGIPKTFRLAA